MLGIEIRPVWKRKDKKAKSEDIPVMTTIAENVAIAEQAIERLAVKVIVGAVVVTGTTVLLTAAGRIIETAFENRTNDK